MLQTNATKRFFKRSFTIKICHLEDTATMYIHGGSSTQLLESHICHLEDTATMYIHGGSSTQLLESHI